MASLLLAAAGLAGAAQAYDLTSGKNLNIYWGQNSYGAAAGANDPANWQKPIGDYCDDDTYDAFHISFLTVSDSTGGYPQIDLANTCSATNNGTFDGTQLADCSSLADGIKKCQNAGKIVTLSIGGATGGVNFADTASAQTFADTVWNVFLGGSDANRPFGDAILDGVDMDIEGGTTTALPDFINQLQTHTDAADKKYYYSAAPQCPFPDAYVGTALNEAKFDFVNVQFYNNYCGVNAYSDSNSWNYPQWADWAKNTSPNPDVKIFIGAPAAQTAASTGYVDAATLGSIATATQSDSTFGGIMLWDVSQAEANNDFGAAIKSSLTGGAKSAEKNKKESRMARRTRKVARWA